MSSPRLAPCQAGSATGTPPSWPRGTPAFAAAAGLLGKPGKCLARADRRTRPTNLPAAELRVTTQFAALTLSLMTATKSTASGSTASTKLTPSESTGAAFCTKSTIAPLAVGQK